MRTVERCEEGGRGGKPGSRRQETEEGGKYYQMR